MSEQCNHTAHNWNVVYQCRNCNEIVPEEIVGGHLAQLEAEIHNNEIRIEERDTKIANQANVITKLEQSRKDMKAENEALREMVKADLLTIREKDKDAYLDALLTGENDGNME